MTRSWLFGALAAGCMGPWPLEPWTVDLPIADTALPDSSDSGGGIDTSVGFVYLGPADGFGFSRSHEIGRAYVEEALAIRTAYADAVQPPAAAAAIAELIAEGHDTIFTASREFDQAALDASSAHPDLQFMQFEGMVTADNIVSYSARMYQALWLAGIVAGHTTETEYIGIVTTTPGPETVRHVDAFTLGVQTVLPEAIVEVTWVLSPNNPSVEADLTEQLLARGADVILSQTGSVTPLEVADGRAWTIGYHNDDACDYGPLTCLMSAYWNWGPLYTELLTERAAGGVQGGLLRWEPFLRDRDASAVGLSDFGLGVTPAAGGAMNDGIAAIEAGPAALPFIGPITDVGGSEQLAPGEAMPDDLLRKVCWLVEGTWSWDPVGGALVPAFLPAPCPPPPPPPAR